MAAPEKKSIIQLLLSPWAILAGIAAGVLIGLYQPSLAAKLAPTGEMYLSLLQMCVLPIMMTAIISSIAPLFAEHEAKYRKPISKRLQERYERELLKAIREDLAGKIVSLSKTLNRAWNRLELGRGSMEKVHGIESDLADILENAGIDEDEARDIAQQGSNVNYITRRLRAKNQSALATLISRYKGLDKMLEGGFSIIKEEERRSGKGRSGKGK